VARGTATRTSAPSDAGSIVEHVEASTRDPATGRERVLATAYELFSRYGTRAVGVDRIIEESGVAKMTLYRNFASKDDLILAFLERREAQWTRAWLQAEVEARADTPGGRLLAVFDTFGEWFAIEGFEGCSFINVMLEVTEPGHPVRDAAITHLATIRSFLACLAEEAGVQDPDAFARQWHILMKGSIVAAAEGDLAAAARARELGAMLLERHGVAA
jgi:AcrR family transcriptional regulator